MQQAAEMAKNMSEDDLKRMGVGSSEEADMMKNMDPAQMESMMNMSASMRGGGGAGGASGGAPPDPSAMMNDPQMMKAAEDMMKNMSPEMLSSMAKASGMDISEDKAKMVAKFLPYMLKLFKVWTYIKKAWTAMWSSRGRVILAVVVLLV